MVAGLAAVRFKMVKPRGHGVKKRIDIGDFLAISRSELFGDVFLKARLFDIDRLIRAERRQHTGLKALIGGDGSVEFERIGRVVGRADDLNAACLDEVARAHFSGREHSRCTFPRSRRRSFRLAAHGYRNSAPSSKCVQW